VGYVIRVAAGLGVGVADAGHMTTLRRADVVVVPLAEDIRIKTYVLHKHRHPALPEVLQRFLAYARTLHQP
jgi:DNA-binding transcriptional LysR family regulator